MDVRGEISGEVSVRTPDVWGIQGSKTVSGKAEVHSSPNTEELKDLFQSTGGNEVMAESLIEFP